MNAQTRVLFLTYNFPPKLSGMGQVIWNVWQRLEERSEAVALAQFGGGRDPMNRRTFIMRQARDSLASLNSFMGKAAA